MEKSDNKIEEHLRIIELLLAGIILKKEVDVKKIAKIIRCSDKKISALYPERRKVNAKKKNKII